MAQYMQEGGRDIRVHDFDSPMETMNSIPNAIRAQKYISLKTFRKSGFPVATPVWFGEQDGKLYVMTRSDMGKTKRIRNNPKVQVAPCTIRGQVNGPEFSATARLCRPGISIVREKLLRGNIAWRNSPRHSRGQAHFSKPRLTEPRFQKGATSQSEGQGHLP